MSEDLDERIGNLLRGDAPAERDALFRVSVLERRERQRFEQRGFALLVAAVAVAVIFLIGFNTGAGLIGIAAIAMVTAGLTLAVVLSIPGVLELVRRFRSVRSATGKN